MADKIEKFTDVWKLPFKKDPEGLHVYIWDSNNHMCFTYFGEGQETYDRIFDLLNGKTDNYFKGSGFSESKIAVTDDPTETDAFPCLLVRGWGYLTGSGGLNLTAEKAVKLQNELAEYACKKLTGK